MRAVVGSLVLCAALGTPSTATQAQESSSPGTERPQLHNISFDHRPFRELLAKVADLHADGLIDFKDIFQITVEAERNTNGTLQDIDIASTATNNESWRELAQEFIVAVSDSRVLAAFDDAPRLSMKLELARENVIASATFEVESAHRAPLLANGYDHLFNAAHVSKSGQSVGIVMSNMTASASGKQLVMKLEMSREQAGNLFRQHLSLP